MAKLQSLPCPYSRKCSYKESVSNFDLVWAKMGGYPWWPALFFWSKDALHEAGLRPCFSEAFDEIVFPKSKSSKLHCLVLFLDEFNFSVLTYTLGKTILPFLSHYDYVTKKILDVKSKKISAQRSSILTALRKATFLLHPHGLIAAEHYKLIERTEVLTTDSLYRQLSPDRECLGNSRRYTTSPRVRLASMILEDRIEDVERDTCQDTYKHDSNKNNSLTKADDFAQDVAVNSLTEADVIIQDLVVNSLTETDNIVGDVAMNSPTEADDMIQDITASSSTEADDIVQDVAVSSDWKEICAPYQSNEGDVVLQDTPLSRMWIHKIKHVSALSQDDIIWNGSVYKDVDEHNSAFDKSNMADDSSKYDRRQSARKNKHRASRTSSIRRNLISNYSDPHAMVQCMSYKCQHNSSDQEAPFQVIAHPDVLFICDLHAHLASCEIIGFLGGRWDHEHKKLYIQAAFPCRSLPDEDDDGATDVEMDPESEVILRDIIREAELEVVGWYHSHPTFAPNPSIKDIENQTNYQRLFRRKFLRSASLNSSEKHSQGTADSDESSEIGEEDVKRMAVENYDTVEPFVGLIIGTYDTSRATPVSLFRFFHTRDEEYKSHIRSTAQNVCLPYELTCKTLVHMSVLADETQHVARSPSMSDAVHIEMCKSEKTDQIYCKDGQGSIKEQVPIKGQLDHQVNCMDIENSLSMQCQDSLKQEETSEHVIYHNHQQHLVSCSDYDSMQSLTNYRMISPVTDYVSGSNLTNLQGFVTPASKVDLFPIDARMDNCHQLSISRENDSSGVCGININGVTGARANAPTENIDNVISEHFGLASEEKLRVTTSYSEIHRTSRAIPSLNASNGFFLHTESLTVNTIEGDGASGLRNVTRRRNRKANQPMKRICQADTDKISNLKILETRLLVLDETILNCEMSNTSDCAKIMVPVGDDPEHFTTRIESAQLDNVAILDSASNDLVEAAKQLHHFATASIGQADANRFVEVEPKNNPESEMFSTPLSGTDSAIAMSLSPIAAPPADPSVPNTKQHFVRSLRTNYGNHALDCVEQILALIDYYGRFPHRTNFDQVWKLEISKLNKLQASLMANVRKLNIPVHQRSAFVQDVIAYIKASWEEYASA